MYLARFSYDILPANRERAIDFIRLGGGAALQSRPSWPTSVRSTICAIKASALGVGCKISKLAAAISPERDPPCHLSLGRT